jgi:hypothetical protein
LENYFGRLTGSSRQQKPGVIKKNAGVRHFLKTGIHRLAAYDSHLCLSKNIGTWSVGFHERSFNPVVIIEALLLDSQKDVMRLPHEQGGGFLVNKTSHIGRAITPSLAMEYFLALHSSEPAEGATEDRVSHRSPTMLLEKVTSFCWVRTLNDYMADDHHGNNSQNEHLLSANVQFICNCKDFWAHLVCPSTLKICDLEGFYHLSSVIREHHRGRSSNNRTPGRRRAHPGRRRADHYLLIDYFGLPDDYTNDALIFIKESSVQQLEKVLKARNVWGSDRIATKFEKIASCIAGTHIGDDISRACISRNHAFPGLHYRVLNQLRNSFGVSAGLSARTNYPFLQNPFPEGSDSMESSECDSYFVRLDTETPIDSGRAHPLGISLCMCFALRGGVTFFDDRRGTFPAIDALSNQCTMVYRDACLAHDPTIHPEKPRILFLEDKMKTFFEDVEVSIPDPLTIEEVEFELPHTADIDRVVDEIVSPFSLLMSQKHQPDETTVSAALLVGPVSLYLFRLWNPDGSHGEGTDCVYALFRPKKIHYWAGGCPMSAYTITVCATHDALHGFLKRILDLPPAGSNLSRAVAPSGKVMARFYSCNIPTLCASTEANYGLSTEVVASSNVGWQTHSQSTETAPTTTTPNGTTPTATTPTTNTPTATTPTGTTAQTNTDMGHSLTDTRQQREETSGNGVPESEDSPANQNSNDQSGNTQDSAATNATVQEGRVSTRVPIVSERMFAEWERTRQRRNERLTRETEDDSSSTSSDSPVQRTPRQRDRNVGWLSRLQRDILLDSDSSTSEDSEQFNHQQSSRPSPPVPNVELTVPTAQADASPSPLPAFVNSHPHRRFFEEHDDRTGACWASYSVVPFTIDGGTEIDIGDEEGEALGEEFARVTGEAISQTGSQCPFCLRGISEADDIAFSNRCCHIMHECCCRQWFQRVGFPSDSAESTGGDVLSELIPMGKCPECRVIGRWRCRHDNKWIPDNKPVYGIHQLFEAELREYPRRRGPLNLVPLRSQLFMVVHIHSPILYAAINIARGYISEVTELASEDTHVMESNRAKLMHKLFLWSLFPNTFPCHRCKKKRPWASLYKWSNCDAWCYAVQCMDCSNVNRESPCQVCGKSGCLQDYNGSPYARNTRQQRRQLHNPGR